jgi:glycosyltransferase involved in cell wall biosynthesis
MIYSTSPHATAHLIALFIARRSGIPWVADFRDPWFEDLPEPGAPAGRLYRKLNRGLERQVVERCTHIVTTTTYLRDSLYKRYTSLPAMKMTAIPNGYDEADFADFAPFPKEHTEHLLIVHAGSINSEFRDPRPLFQALRALIHNGTIARNRVMLRFIGGGEFARSQAIRTSLSQNGLSEQVEFVDRMSYGTALQELARADLLLLLQASADTVDLIPAKIYEYLRAQKPVLALVYPGATSELLGTVRGGWAVDPRDAAALENSIAFAYDAWRSNRLAAHSARPEAVCRFDRKALAGELANLFDRLCTNQSR